MFGAKSSGFDLYLFLGSRTGIIQEIERTEKLKMKLNYMKVSHLFGLDETEFNFDESNLISIVGENGSGKSSIMDCVVFALLGHATPSRGVKIEDYIKRGATSGSVELIFTDMGGVQRKVSRTLALKRKNIAHTVVLSTYDESTQSWINESDMLTDVLAKVASILMKGTIESGSQEEIKSLVKQAESALLISAFISQGNIAQILSVTPAARMELIASAFNITGSDRLKTEAKELKKLADIEYKEILSAQKTLQERLNSFEASKDVLKDRQATAAGNAKCYAEYKRAYQDIYTALSVLNKTVVEYATSETKRKASEDKFIEAQNYEAAKTAAEAHKKYINSAKELEESFSLHQGLKKKKSALDLEVQRLTTEEDNAKKTIVQKSSEYTVAEKYALEAPKYRRKKELWETIGRWESELSDTEQKLKENQKEYKELSELLKEAQLAEDILKYREAKIKLDTAKTAAKARSEAEKAYEKNERLANMYPKLEEAKKIREELKDLKTRKAESQEDIEKYCIEIKEAQKQISDYTQKLVWKKYIESQDIYSRISKELSAIEKNMADTLISLLSDLSENGIIDLKNISSDCAAQWVESFEKSSLKSLVLKSGTLKEQLISSQKTISELAARYSFLEDSPVKAEESIERLESLLESIQTQLNFNDNNLRMTATLLDGYEKTIFETEIKLKTLGAEIVGVDADAIKNAEERRAELLAAKDTAVADSIRCEALAYEAKDIIKNLTEKYPDIEEKYSTATDEALFRQKKNVERYKKNLTKLESSAEYINLMIKQLKENIDEALNEFSKTVASLPSDISETEAMEAERDKPVLAQALNKARDEYFAVKEKRMRLETELSKISNELVQLNEILEKQKTLTDQYSAERQKVLSSYAEANNMTIEMAAQTVENIKAPIGYVSLEAIREVYAKASGTAAALKKQMDSHKEAALNLIEKSSDLPERIDNISEVSCSMSLELSRKYEGLYLEAERTAASLKERIEQYNSTERQLKSKEAELDKLTPLRTFVYTLAEMTDGKNFTRFMSDMAMSLLLGGVNSYLERIGENWTVISQDGELFVCGADEAPRPVSGMSGGEQVLISVLLLKHISNFGCLWLDESLPNLDERRLKETVDILTAESNSQLLLTTHDPELARLFPKTWEMEKGRLRAESI